MLQLASAVFAPNDCRVINLCHLVEPIIHPEYRVSVAWLPINLCWTNDRLHNQTYNLRHSFTEYSWDRRLQEHLQESKVENSQTCLYQKLNSLPMNSDCTNIGRYLWVPTSQFHISLEMQGRVIDRCVKKSMESIHERWKTLWMTVVCEISLQSMKILLDQRLHIFTYIVVQQIFLTGGMCFLLSLVYWKGRKKVFYCII